MPSAEQRIIEHELATCSVIYTVKACLGRHSLTMSPLRAIRTANCAGSLTHLIRNGVEIRGAAYPALVGARLLGQVGERVREHFSHKTCAIISDVNVAPL